MSFPISRKLTVGAAGVFALALLGLFFSAGGLSEPAAPPPSNDWLRSSSSTTGQIFEDIPPKTFMEKLSDSAQGFVIGLLLFCVSGPLLAWNECQAARYYRMLFRARDALKKSQKKERVDIDKNDIKLDGKLICVHGTLDCKDRTVRDDQFNFEIKHCVRLKRTVQMYQWHETVHEEKKNDGGKRRTYRYSKQWSEIEIDSKRFHHAAEHTNPEWWIQAKSTNNDVKEADYGTKANMKVRGAVISEMNWYTKKGLTQIPFECFEDKIPPGASATKHTTVCPFGPTGAYYAFKGTGNDRDPDIGDVKVSYQWVPDSVGSADSSKQVTVMAKQCGRSFEPWADSGDFCYDTVGGCIFSAACFCFVGGSNGDAYAIGDDDEEEDPKDYKTFADQEDKDTERRKGWFEICNAAPGSMKASELLKQNESSGRAFQMILRVVGWIMMFVGLQLVFEPLFTLLDVIPIIGPIVRFSVSLLAFLFTLLLSFIIIAIAWFSSRPKLVIGAGIIILAVLRNCG